MSPVLSLTEELARSTQRVSVKTKHGVISSRKVTNGSIVFLELPYALPPERFSDARPLPEGFQYEDKEYILETAYAVQPGNDGQSAGIPKNLKLGQGEPSENPLFVNIVVPPSFDASSGRKFPVRIYIHGGFLQFGSPHSFESQAHLVASERSEIWVNVGYRLSAFGFLACDEPRVDGNFGFKDQWLALEWVRKNIDAFSGDVNDIQVTGLSAGAHSVHQILHHASRLPAGQTAPFQSAMLQSNAMISTPKTVAQLHEQFHALCKALALDPSAPDILTTLRDPVKVPWQTIVSVIEDESKMGPYGTFRGCLDGDWLATSPDPMAWQRSGDLARSLKEKGVRYVIVGDLSEEWYLYAIAHPISQPSDVRTNLLRYYPEDMVDKQLRVYPKLDENADAETCMKLFGRIASDAQVHLPVRLFARDMQRGGMPVLRYHIAWTPLKARKMLSKEGYVTHATDRALWCYRTGTFSDFDFWVVRDWLTMINKLSRALGDSTMPARHVKEAFTLTESRALRWESDARWDELMEIAKILPQES